jgi:hypothetical protein
MTNRDHTPKKYFYPMSLGVLTQEQINEIYQALKEQIHI